MKRAGSVLSTDLYQLAMLQTYVEHGMDAPAVFEFFVRTLPVGRNFLLAAGLEQVLEYLEQLHLEPEELAYLARTGRFSEAALRYLERLRFTGDVEAMPEGTVCFPSEPILRVCAPLPQAQVIESRVINLLHLETVIASKAVRSVLAAPGKLLVDFGLRRSHGEEAGLLAARAAYAAGFSGSSNVLAEAVFGVPAYGTMAHSFIQAHEDESEAFARYARSHPGRAVLLLDTYDTEAAAKTVVRLAEGLRREGISIRAVRIDSGDLAAHARRVRQILDAGGLKDVRVFASGGLDEDQVRDLESAGAPIDGYGIGTRLGTSADAPSLDCAYKLQEYAGRACRKRSEGKATWPGRKQVWRRAGPDGRMAQDVIGLEDERQEGESLIHPVLREGRRVADPVPLEAIRRRAAEQVAKLPEALRMLDAAPAYPVTISDRLRALARDVDARRVTPGPGPS